MSVIPAFRPLSAASTIDLYGPELVGAVTVPAVRVAAVEALMGSAVIRDLSSVPFGVSGAYAWVDGEDCVHYVGCGDGGGGVSGRLNNEIRWVATVDDCVAQDPRPWTNQALWSATPLPKWIYGFELKPVVIGPTNWTSRDPRGAPTNGREVERFLLEAACQVIGRRAVLGGSAWEPSGPLGTRADAWATERITQLRGHHPRWKNLVA